MGRDLAPLLIATVAYILAMLWMAGRRSGCLGDGRGLEDRGRIPARKLFRRGRRGASRAAVRAKSSRALNKPLASRRDSTNKRLPNTHVPVVVCRLAGIWTRGQSTAPGRPATGGEPANPAQRGTRLEATTDRAFLVSAGPPKVGDQRGLSILPGVRTVFLVQTMAFMFASTASPLEARLATAQQLICLLPSASSAGRRAIASAGQRLRFRVSIARGEWSHRRRSSFTFSGADWKPRRRGMPL